MCTSIKLKSKDGKLFWGRTQDLNVPMFGEDGGVGFDECIIDIPKNENITSQLSNWTSRYSVMGMGVNESYMLNDGINDQGLVGNSQVLMECTWRDSDSVKEDKNLIPLLGEEFVTYILTHYKSTSEIKRDYANFCLVNQKYEYGGHSLQYPLHYSFIDPDGTGIVLEPTENGQFKLYNHIGVMANSPEYSYHETNIRNYIGLSNVDIKNTVTLDGIQLNPIEGGTGYGLFGIPGDFTSPSRFVRSFFIKSFIDEFDSVDGILSLYNSFRSIIIPRGLEHAHKGDVITDLTRYWAGYDVDKKTIHVQTCRSLDITQHELNPNLSEVKYTKL